MHSSLTERHRGLSLHMLPAVSGILVLGGGYAGLQSGAPLNSWLLFGVVAGLELVRGGVMALMARAYPGENLSAP